MVEFIKGYDLVIYKVFIVFMVYGVIKVISSFFGRSLFLEVKIVIVLYLSRGFREEGFF